MNISPDAIETYQNTTTLLLAYKLAERELMPKSKGNAKAAKAKLLAINKIANRIRHSANVLAGQTKDPVLYETLMSIVKHRNDRKVIETLTLTHNTMLRDNML